MKSEAYKILIEIPKGTKNEKWEYDHKTGKMVLDFVFQNLIYPYNYGEVVGTLGGDGDPLDAIVFSSEPLKQSDIVDCIPFGIAKVIDRGEVDDKLLFVPAKDPLAGKYKDIADFSQNERKAVIDFNQEIARQKKKVMEIKSFENKSAAVEILKNSLV